MQTPLDLPSLDVSTFGQRKAPTLSTPRKLLKHLEGDDYVMEMDWSSLERMLSCDRAAFYSLVESRSTYPTPALVFGAALHSSLEHLYRCKHGDIMLSLDDLVDKARPHFDANPPPLNEWRNLDRLVETIRRYIKEYTNETFEILEDTNKVPYIERSFAMPLGKIAVNERIAFAKSQIVANSIGDDTFYVSNIHVVWTGIIDLIVRQNDRIWIVDHKTTSISGPTYFKAFELSQQFLGYCWSTSQLLLQPIAGAIANVVVGRAPTKTGVAIDFERQFLQYPTYRVDEWPASINALCSDLVHRLVTGFFPMKTSWCVGKYGICPYFSVCEMPPEHRHMMLYSDQYTTNTWNPVNDN